MGDGSNLDDEEFALGEREFMFLEQVTGPFGIVDDQAKDGAIGCVEGSDGEDMDVMLLEKHDEIVEATDAVFGED